MHSDCILGSVANLFVCHMVFVSLHSISSQGLGSFSRFLDLKLRKPIVDLDLIDKDRIYK